MCHVYERAVFVARRVVMLCQGFYSIHNVMHAVFEPIRLHVLNILHMNLEHVLVRDNACENERWTIWASPRQ